MLRLSVIRGVCRSVLARSVSRSRFGVRILRCDREPVPPGSCNWTSTRDGSSSSSIQVGKHPNRTRSLGAKDAIRESIQKSKKEIAALQKSQPAFNPVLAIIQAGEDDQVLEMNKKIAAELLFAPGTGADVKCIPLAMPVSSAKRTITLHIESDIKYRTIHNVIGYLKGITNPDRYVLVGSHHDSWYDKNGGEWISGAAINTELIGSLVTQVRNGWQPDRTTVFCSWGGSAFGNIGSYEWAEEMREVLESNAVAYVSLYNPVRGNGSLHAIASPSLQQLAAEAINKRLSLNCTRRGKCSRPDVSSVQTQGDVDFFANQLGIPTMEFAYRETKTGELSRSFDTLGAPEPRCFGAYTPLASIPSVPLMLRCLRASVHRCFDSQSQERAVIHTAIVTEHLARLGLILYNVKSQLTLVQSTLYLGLRLDSLTMQTYLSDDRVAAIQNCLALFQQGSTVQLVLCQKLLSLMAAASSAIPLGLLHIRPAQMWLNAFQLHPKHDRHHWQDRGSHSTEGPIDSFDIKCSVNTLPVAGISQKLVGGRLLF
ncbi:UNVERIFIED_CONTAM: hypothetical protein FKN15_028052 [Acipenser sinensis]